MENGKANSGSNPKGRLRVVVVGSGFAGFTCARELERRLRPEDAELVLASPTDYLLYSPLLPEVATGVIDPRHIAVPLHGVLKRTRIIPGDTTGVDLDARTCAVRPPNTPERVLGSDRLVLAPGGVTRSFPIPGLAEKARGLKSLGEAMYLRDHVLQQLELADASDDPDERRAQLREMAGGTLEAALTGSERMYGGEHPMTGGLLRALGAIRDAQGDAEDARRHRERSEICRRRNLRGADADGAVAIDRAGRLLTNWGLYDEAQAYLERALAIREDVLASHGPCRDTPKL